jgi:hypothetical protein
VRWLHISRPVSADELSGRAMVVIGDELEVAFPSPTADD